MCFSDSSAKARSRLTARPSARGAGASRAYVWTSNPRGVLTKLSNLDSVIGPWAVGGVAAANLYAPTLTADPPLTIWVPDAIAPEVIAKALGGEVVSEGSNLILWQTPGDPWAQHHYAPQSSEHSVQALYDSRFPASAHVATAEEREHAHWVRALHQATLTPPPPSKQAAVALVSPPRALVEARRDGSGRAEEVAEALRERLALPPNLY